SRTRWSWSNRRGSKGLRAWWSSVSATPSYPSPARTANASSSRWCANPLVLYPKNMNENPLIPADNRPEPDDAEGFFRRGNRHLDAGSYDSAIADYSSAIQLDPTDADPYFNRGLAYRNSGRLVAALD